MSPGCKHIVSSLFLLAAVTACQVQELDGILSQGGESQFLEFTADFGDGLSTRTSITSVGKILWSPGESISIFYGNSGESSGSEFVSQNTSPNSTATFSGTITAFTGLEEGGQMMSFWAVYPYSASNRCDGNSVIGTLPSEQVAVEENFADNTTLMVSKSPGLALPFYNVGTFLRVCFSRSDISSMTFNGRNGEIVSGRVSVTMDSAGEPEWSSIEGEGSKYVRLSAPGGGCFESGKYYYFTFLPQAFSNGWSLTFETSGGEIGRYDKEGSAKFYRAESKNASNRDEGITFQTLYVDMGDGVMWATMNVGASTPDEYGDYFAWAETEPKSNYSWSTYSYGTEESLTKYNSTDSLTVLQPEDDAATVNWGGDWRTPTTEEWTWLYDNCTWVWQYNPNGYIVTSKVNGNSIFIPAAGYYWEQYNYNYKGYYWSSDISSSSLSEAYIRMFDVGSNTATTSARSVGRSVRPVRGQSAAERYVELGPGVRWAKMNIGAGSPEESGNYYAWGETVPKDEYTNTNYAFGTYRALTKYVNNSEYGTVDGRTTLLPQDDAATAAWGGDWRTPTSEEWNWLNNSANCTMTEETVNGVSGFRYTSVVSGYEGNSVFIPKAGYYDMNNPTTVREGIYRYWSSVMCYGGNSHYAWSAFGSYYNNSMERFNGLPVRAVYMPRVSLASIEMTQSSITVGVELTQSLYVDKYPSDATEKGVIWTSSNESVAKVSGWGEVTGVSPGTATITAVSVDGGFSTNCTVTVIPSYVDMGGGMEWATFNVGAGTPTDAGDYYAWGEILPKTSYIWNTYRLGREDNMWYYNSTDGFVTLLRGRDVATYRMGGLWHIPSSAEWDWLHENCNWTWQEDYQSSGKPGFVVTSNETNGSIFLPAAGEFDLDLGPSNFYGACYYWASNLYADSLMNYNLAASVMLSNDLCNTVCDDYRYLGKTIRAVRRKWVDMGDGLKWATTNVGGFYPEDYGDYFAWGEITPKDDYSWSTYKWGTSSTTLTKYVTTKTYGTVDNRTQLLRPSSNPDDAAFANWGATWRMPTDEEWLWLKDNCTQESTTENGVYGKKLTSKSTGNSIFLPAAGDQYGTSPRYAGSIGRYWSSSLDEDGSDYARVVLLNSEEASRASVRRYLGFSVRPVSE